MRARLNGSAYIEYTPWLWSGGINCVGGAGVFLSTPLLKQIGGKSKDCLALANSHGDKALSLCIYKYTTTKLSVEHNLYQLEMFGDPNGFYEARVALVYCLEPVREAPKRLINRYLCRRKARVPENLDAAPWDLVFGDHNTTPPSHKAPSFLLTGSSGSTQPLARFASLFSANCRLGIHSSRGMALRRVPSAGRANLYPPVWLAGTAFYSWHRLLLLAPPSTSGTAFHFRHRLPFLAPPSTSGTAFYFQTPPSTSGTAFYFGHRFLLPDAAYLR
ncbi:hypothetical protein DL765_010294 [Monosporascus sp. GIB2]|nr:hypothetical protein DL765_010294 [Monosporascus sp. GIB2]